MLNARLGFIIKFCERSAHWEPKARVEINFTIREGFKNPLYFKSLLQLHASIQQLQANVVQCNSVYVMVNCCVQIGHRGSIAFHTQQ